MAPRSRSSCFTFSDREMPVRFGRYYLLARRQVDPVGEEFLAAWGVEEGLDQLRTVRCVYPRIAEEAEFVALFSEEARSLSRLSSANVVRVMEVGREGEIPFVAREHVEGVTLARLLQLAEQRKALWPWELAAHVAAELLRGLDYVHRREDIHGSPLGMRHGDLRLEHVVISFNGEVKLTSFGSTLRFIVDERTNAQLSEIRRRYQPPEGVSEVEPEVAGDLWGAGVILVALLLGRLPSMTGAGPGGYWVPPQLAHRIESMPEVLDTFLARALNPDPAYRFADAAEMREALLGIVGEHVAGHPPDDLAAFVRDLGEADREEEARLVRRLIGQEARLDLDQAAAGDGALGPGKVLDGRYHLLRQLGEGGMGLVFEAEHLGLGRRVALKVLHDIVVDDGPTIERFRREAQIIGKLGHPHIVGALDFGVSEDGYHFLAMELLEGESLTERIARGDLAPRELARAMAEVCDGLQAAHDAGVIHRDLKPDNIYLTPTGARILDFGIAKRTGLDEEDQALTRTGHICGTVDYIAPEQIRGMSQDPRSDLYAVGVILYEALTGKPPFHGRTVGETLHRVINDKLVPPRKRTGDRTIPSEIEAVCVKALARRAERRYQSAAELARALRALLPNTDGLIPAHATRRRSWPLLVGGGVALAAVAGLAIALLRGGAVAPTAGGGDGTAVAELTRTRADAGAATPVVVHLAARVDAGAPAPAPPAATERPGKPDAGDANAPAIAAAEPSDARARAAELVSRGNRELGRMRLDRAAELYEEALALDPRSAGGQFGLGRVAFEQGRVAEAERRIRAALRHRPASARYRNFLGQVLLTLGQRDRAIAEWRGVLARTPGNAEARRLLRAAGVAEP